MRQYIHVCSKFYEAACQDQNEEVLFGPQYTSQMKASQLVISVILGLRPEVNQKPCSGRFPLVQVL